MRECGGGKEMEDKKEGGSESIKKAIATGSLLCTSVRILHIPRYLGIVCSLEIV